MGDRRAAVEHAGDARVLRQVAEAALAHDLAAGRLERAAEHPEQAGLAGTVAPDEADLVAGITVNEASSMMRRPPTSTESPLTCNMAVYARGRWRP